MYMYSNFYVEEDKGSVSCNKIRLRVNTVFKFNSVIKMPTFKKHFDSYIHTFISFMCKYYILIKILFDCNSVKNVGIYMYIYIHASKPTYTHTYVYN